LKASPASHVFLGPAPCDYKSDVIRLFTPAELLGGGHYRLEPGAHRHVAVNAQGLAQAGLAELLPVGARRLAGGAEGKCFGLC
jgi:hypothetical protein